MKQMIFPVLALSAAAAALAMLALSQPPATAKENGMPYAQPAAGRDFMPATPIDRAAAARDYQTATFGLG